MDPNIDVTPASEAETALENIDKSKTTPAASKALSTYEIGDQIAGETITYIYYSNNHFLIYRSAQSNLSYQIRHSSPKIPRIINEFSKYGREYRRLLRGAYRVDYSNLMASCLNSALLSADDASDDISSHFEPVTSFIEERGPIEYVYGYGQNFIVYLNKRGVVSYEYTELPSRLIAATEEFHRLQHVARAALRESDRADVVSILGTDLLSVFRSPENADPSLSFFSSKDFITNRSEALLRSKYISSSVLSSLAALLILLPTVYLLKQYSIETWIVLLGCTAGVIGATISIIQRGVTLTVNPFVPVSHVAFQGIVRVILGIVFGGLLIAAAEANIALGILNDNVWSLFIFSVVAGFSERFIPDILDRIATQSGGQNKS